MDKQKCIKALIDNLYEVPSKENIYKCEIYYDNMDDLLSFYKELSKYNYPLEYSIMNNDIENNYIDIDLIGGLSGKYTYEIKNNELILTKAFDNYKYVYVFNKNN